MPIICIITGSDIASASGFTIKTKAPVLALCRILVEAGHDPNERLEAYRGPTLCISISSIGEGARLRISDNKGRESAQPSMAAASSMRSRDEAATSIAGA